MSAELSIQYHQYVYPGDYAMIGAVFLISNMIPFGGKINIAVRPAFEIVRTHCEQKYSNSNFDTVGDQKNNMLDLFDGTDVVSIGGNYGMYEVGLNGPSLQWFDQFYAYNCPECSSTMWAGGLKGESYQGLTWSQALQRVFKRWSLQSALGMPSMCEFVSDHLSNANPHASIGFSSGYRYADHFEAGTYVYFRQKFYGRTETSHLDGSGVRWYANTSTYGNAQFPLYPAVLNTNHAYYYLTYPDFTYSRGFGRWISNIDTGNVGLYVYSFVA